MRDTTSRSLDFQVLFEQAPGLYLVLTPGLHIVAASNAFLSATGARRADIIGRFFFDLFPETPAEQRGDARRQTMESFRRISRTKVPDAMMVQQYDLPRPASEGGGFAVRYWSPINSPVLDARGEVEYIIHRVEDVTDYMLLQYERSTQELLISGTHSRMLKTEAELFARTRDVANSNVELKSGNEALARQFRATFEQAAVGLAHVGLQGEWLRVNGTLCRMLGYSAEALQALTFQQITHPDDLDSDVALMERMLRSEIDTYAIEKRYLRSDGNAIWAELTASIVRDEQRSPLYFISVIADISARKAAEEALQRANRRMEEFLAILAHELRNPLAPIRNGVALLGMTPEANTPVVQRMLPMMERQLSHMSRLLDDLLDASRISHDRIELVRQPVEVNAIVEALAETVRPQFAGRGHDLQVTLPTERIIVAADPVRLTQMIANLLDNASKFSPQPGTIRMDVARENAIMLLRVRDDGIGIDGEHLHTIFEPFSQVETSTRRSHGGLGIGLSLVHSFAELQGGSVEAHSDGIGRGSEFIVRLPVLANESPAEAARFATGHTGELRVLVVDDAPDAASSLAELVGVLGNDVRAVNGGAEALGVVEEFRPQLVLLDLGMPDMDGYETCRRLRRQEGGEQLRIVAITGWGRDEDRERTTLAGFDQHIVKPIAPEALRRVLSEVRNAASA